MYMYIYRKREKERGTTLTPSSPSLYTIEYTLNYPLPLLITLTPIPASYNNARGPKRDEQNEAVPPLEGFKRRFRVWIAFEIGCCDGPVYIIVPAYLCCPVPRRSQPVSHTRGLPKNIIIIIYCYQSVRLTWPPPSPPQHHHVSHPDRVFIIHFIDSI